MMAYTLAKAAQDLTDRLGPYDIYGWQFKNLKKVEYQHPFYNSPLIDLFKVFRNFDIGIWTPNEDSLAKDLEVK